MASHRGVRRTDAVDALCAEVDRAVGAGAGLTVRLVGEAGIGKTTVAEQLAATARRAGASIWRGGAVDIAAAAPFAAVGSLRADDGQLLTSLDGWRELASAERTGLSSVDAERHAIHDRVVELGEGWASAPTFALVEDLHWADPTSLEVCLALAEVSVSSPLVLVVNHRPVQPGDPLGRWLARFQTTGVRSVELEPLADDEIAHLVESLTGSTPDAALLRRVSGAAGNPFLVREFLDGLLSQGVLTASSIPADGAVTPQQLQQAVAGELALLGDDVTRTLRAASVLGGPLDVECIAALLDAGVIDLAEPIERARTARLLDERDGVLHFRHELVRHAVYERMPMSLRSALHRQVASILTARGAPMGVIGSHLVLGVVENDPDAAELLQAAAADIVLLDPTGALDFLERAGECAPNDLATRKLIERARMDALTAAGRLDEADAVLHWLLGVAEPDDRAELLARRAGIATMAGESDRAMDYLRQALDLAVGDVVRSPILALASVTWAQARHLDEAKELAEAALAAGERTDEPIGRSVGLAMLGRMAVYRGDLETGLAHGARSVAIADADTSGAAHSYIPCLHQGTTAFDADLLDEAMRMVHRGNAVADQHGFSWTRPLFSALASAVHYRRGVVDEARAEAEAGVSAAEDMSSRATLTWSHGVVALSAIDQGDLDVARHHAGRGWELLSSGQSVLGPDHLVLAGARLAAADDGPEAAHALLCGSWDEFVELALHNCLPLLAFDLAVLARQLGDEERLRTVCSTVRSLAETTGVDATMAIAEVTEAMLGKDETIGRAAFARLVSTERRLEVAQWLATVPELVAHDVDDARRRARAIYLDAGASARADALGVAGAGRAADGPWSTLTPSEEAIVRLLARGFTNAQIAAERRSSRRTVESHLGRVYRKLGIDGRVALTVAATARFGSTGS